MRFLRCRLFVAAAVYVFLILCVSAGNAAAVEDRPGGLGDDAVDVRTPQKAAMPARTAGATRGPAEALSVHFFVIPLRGHYNGIKGIVGAAADAGHRVTLVCCDKTEAWVQADRAPGGVLASDRVAVLNAGPCPAMEKNAELVRIHTDTTSSSFEALNAVTKGLQALADTNLQMCEGVMPAYDAAFAQPSPVARTDAAAASELDVPDVIVFDGETSCGVDVALRFGVPRVASIATGVRNIATLPLNNPAYITGLPLDMTLGQRIFNALFVFANRLALQQDYLLNYYARDRERWGIGHHRVSSARLYEHVPTLYATHWGLEYPRPTEPHEFLVGHTADLDAERRVQPLSVGLQTWLDGSNRDVVFVSFGTVVRADSVVVNAMEKAVLHLLDSDVRLVWAAHESLSDSLSQELARRNGTAEFLVLPFVPQVATLFHKAVQVFVTHGGMNGVAEGIAAGVPMVCIPFFNDQLDNCQRVASHGMGTRLDYATASAEEITTAVQQFRRNTEAASALSVAQSHNRLVDGRATAVRVIEFTAQQGDQALANHEPLLPFYRRFHLDLWLTLVGIVVGTWYLRVCSCCCACCCKRKDSADRD